jgi:threonine dehydratase
MIGALFIEDGKMPPIAEGAGTIGLELGRMDEPLDAVLVPVGDGALVSGIGTWMRRAAPSMQVIGVVAEGAPAMALSWRAGRVITTQSVTTIADGIAVRDPIPEAFDDMKDVVDDVVTVSDGEIVEAMGLLLDRAGLAVEPAGAAGLAAMTKLGSGMRGRRVGVIVTGGNISAEQVGALLQPLRSRSAR